MNQFRDGFFRNFSRAERIHEDGNGLRDANRIRQLNLAAIRNPRRHDIFRHIARRIRRRTIHFRRILSGERAAAVPRHAAIRVDDNFPARQPRIPLRPADHKAPRRIDVIFRLRIQILRRNHRADDVFNQILFNRLVRNLFPMLRRNDNRLDAHRFPVIIFHRHLRLAVRPQIRKRPILSDLGQTTRKTMRHRERQRQKFRRLIRRVAEHHPLIARADIILVRRVLLRFERLIHAHRDIRRLLVHRHQNAARLAIETVLRAVVPDFLDRLPNDFRKIDARRRRDFPENMHLSRRDNRLARDTPARILHQNGIQHRIGNLIANFIRMSFRHRFRRKKHFLRHFSLLRKNRSHLCQKNQFHKKIPRKREPAPSLSFHCWN